MFDPKFWLNHYPGTNFHEMNIDWLVEAVKELASEMHDFEVTNSIHYEGNFDITKQYPAWSIVVDNDFGYISLKPVPAGISINNTDYWENIADFSALYADLGSRVTALENDVNIINNKITNDHVDYWKHANVLFIGDSYLGGYDGQTTVNDYSYYMNQQLHFNTYYKVAEGGSKFSTVSGNHFMTNVIAFVTNHTADVCESITDLFIMGGYNDFPAASVSDIVDNPAYGIRATVAYCKQHFPNAKIRIAMIGRALYATQFNPNFPKFNMVVKAYKEGAFTCGVEYMEGSELLMHDYRMFASDNVHPTSYGYTCLGYMLTELLLNKDFDYLYTRDATNEFNLDFTGSNFTSCPFTLYQTLDRGGVTLDIYGGQHTINTPIASWEAVYTNKILIGNMKGAAGGVNLFLPHYDIYVPVSMAIKHDNGQTNVNGFIVFGSNGEVSISCTHIKDDTFSYETFTNVTNIVFGKASHSIPLQLC